MVMKETELVHDEAQIFQIRTTIKRNQGSARKKKASSLDSDVLSNSGKQPKENRAVPVEYASSLHCQVLAKALDTHSLGRIGYRQGTLLQTRDG